MCYTGLVSEEQAAQLMGEIGQFLKNNRDPDAPTDSLSRPARKHLQFCRDWASIDALRKFGEFIAIPLHSIWQLALHNGSVILGIGEVSCRVYRIDWPARVNALKKHRPWNAFTCQDECLDSEQLNILATDYFATEVTFNLERFINQAQQQ